MEEKVAVLSDGPMPYIEIGTGPTLLFYHGAFAMPHAYDDLLMRLATEFHVIAPTHPGHGESFPINRDWTLDQLISDHREFIRKIRIKPEIFVGHSFGGMVAILLSENFPGVRVIAMDAPGFPLPITNMSKYLRAMIDETAHFFKQKPGYENLEDIATAAGTIFRTLMKHPEDIPLFYRYGPALDLSAKFKKLAGRINIFWGEDDHIVPLTDGKKMHQLLTGSTLTVFPGLTHIYPVTQPEFTFAKIMQTLIN